MGKQQFHCVRIDSVGERKEYGRILEFKVNTDFQMQNDNPQKFQVVELR